jgi:hypothetical protein
VALSRVLSGPASHAEGSRIDPGDPSKDGCRGSRHPSSREEILYRSYPPQFANVPARTRTIGTGPTNISITPSNAFVGWEKPSSKCKSMRWKRCATPLSSGTTETPRPSIPSRKQSRQGQIRRSIRGMNIPMAFVRMRPRTMFSSERDAKQARISRYIEHTLRKPQAEMVDFADVCRVRCNRRPRRNSGVSPLAFRRCDGSEFLNGLPLRYLKFLNGLLLYYLRPR